MNEPAEPQRFYLGDRRNLEDIEMPPPPAWLVAAWAKEPKPEWTITIGEGKP